jgi:hypothetical protein
MVLSALYFFGDIKAMGIILIAPIASIHPHKMIMRKYMNICWAGSIEIR